MDPEMIGQHALDDRNDRAADNSHDQQAGAVAGQRTEFRNPQGENAGEHDRVKESDQDDAPHGDVAEREHGGADQQSGDDRSDSKDRAGADFLQNGRSDEASNHGAAPVVGNVTRGHCC